MAQDLRETIVGAIRMASDLERIGDLAKNIAKRVGAVGQSVDAAQTFRIGIEHLAELVLTQVKKVLDAYRRARRRKAREVCAPRTRRSTSNTPSLFRELLTYMMEDPRNITMPARICCSAPRTSSASATTPPTSPKTPIISITGEQLPANRPKLDETAHYGAGRIGQGTMIAAADHDRGGRGAADVLLRYNLEAEGYEVEVVARGDEAEMRLREHMPDLLVLDWMLPGRFRHRALPAAADARRDRSGCRSSC